MDLSQIVVAHIARQSGSQVELSRSSVSLEFKCSKDCWLRLSSRIPFGVYLRPGKCFVYGQFETLVRSTVNQVWVIVREHVVSLLLKRNTSSYGIS